MILSICDDIKNSTISILDEKSGLLIDTYPLEHRITERTIFFDLSPLYFFKATSVRVVEETLSSIV